MKYINDFTRDELEIPAEAEIFWRPSVYAVIVKDDSILMVRPDHELWALPGGGMEPNESVEEALKREVSEETGYTVESSIFFDTAERYFYHEKDKKFYHVIALVYRADINDAAEAKPKSIADGEVSEVSWVKLFELNKDNCHFLVLPIINKPNLPL